MNEKTMANVVNVHGQMIFTIRFFANISPFIDNNGCLPWNGGTRGEYGSLRVNGKTIPAHRVAYEYWVGKISDGMCILHRCDNPLCVAPDHLFVGTRADNNKDRAMKGRSADTHGEKHPRAVMTESEVKEVLASGESLTILSKRMGIKYGTLWRIVHGNNWKKTKEKIGYEVKPMDKRRGEKHSQAVLTEAQVMEALVRKESLMILANRFGVKYNTLWNAVKGRTWKYLQGDANE